MASPLLDRLMGDIKTAMKAGDKDNLTALRMLHAQVKDATTNQGKEPTDADVAAVLAKAIKQRQDALAQFQQAGRTDLAAREQAELDLFKRYQPEQLGEAQILDLIRKAVAETGATSRKEMGKVMAALQPHVKGRADGKLVSQLVQSQLPG
jgi:uncharacterized protein YqeY